MNNVPATVGAQIVTLDDLRARRDEILAIAARYGVTNVRVFGSVARGEAMPQSDIDFLVTFPRTATIFDVVKLWDELQTFLGRDVDLIEDHPQGGKVMRAALGEAIAL